MKLFFRKNSLFLARISSFLAVLLLLVNYYLLLILNNFFSISYGNTASSGLANGGFIAMISLFSFLGVALGAVICPFFMPFSGSTIQNSSAKPLLKPLIFILIINIPNIILRSMGADLWASSLPARFFIHVLSGMLYPICLGLFLQTRLIAGSYEKDQSCENRTGRYGIFFFAFAVVGGIIIRHIYLLLLERFNIASNPLQAMNLTYNIINIFMLLIGCFIITCLVLLNRFNLTEQKQPGFTPTDTVNLTASGSLTASNNLEKTNWPVILRLFGLAVVFRVLNSIMEMRLFPRLTYSMNSFDLHPIVLVIAIPLLALLAGWSINRFLKIFIPAAITIFILLPCILFFNEYPNFLLFMEILVGLLNNLIWVVFTFAIIEHYAGGFWFYALASSIHFTTLFAMVSPMTRQFIPAGTEFTILICGIAAVLLCFLVSDLFFPKFNLLPLMVL